MSSKNCIACGIAYTKRPKDTGAKWEFRKYCSSKCYQTTQKGKYVSEETKAKISKAGKGRKPSPESVARGVETRRKQGWTSQKPEVRKKISETLKGRPQPWNRGKNHVMWKGGVELRKCLYGLLEYKEWRTAVFERDDYICQLCGISNKKGLGVTVVLNADHYPVPLFRFIDKINRELPDGTNEEKKQYARDYTEMWDIRNGRTLCLSCHKETPTWGRARKEEYGRDIMPLENELHLVQILEGVGKRLDAKYSSGFLEHGGLLSDLSTEELLDNAIDEAIDQVTYLLTLKNKREGKS